MAQGPIKKLHSERTRIERYDDDGTLPRETTDALLEWASALHPHETEFEYVTPDGERNEFAISTVQSYLRSMRKVAQRAFPNLLGTSPDTFNDAIDAMQTGENPNVKEGGLAKTTLGITQSAAKTFFWYFELAHPDEINAYGERSTPKHDEDDLFSREDVQALRAHIKRPRDRALLELLLNTGQRISAIQGLRIKDIDIEAGLFSLNTERGGLKGAARRSEHRPLLGSKPFLADWLDAHPLSDNPDAYLFVGDPEHHYTDINQPLCQSSIRRMLERTAERANVEKPVNPHNFRHYWTTTMKQDYGLNDEEIKYLLGHKREGNGVNFVYNHSTDAKLQTNTERKVGTRDGPTAKPLTPESCGECGEDLESHWTCCPVCGTRYCL
ncbi:MULTISPECIES: tyrosine-type recombinase/integrase [Halorussus]|uniref:tyrosine-type recombinase/integrase n=1 Tax=Halorussus TaxID=1070314 RepID=UPI0020A19E9A|nr:tyrosine-type recombinase/integrase [Halorussus vallis]USZ74354.1 site-specific integrase [Halorussus vallis]